MHPATLCRICDSAGELDTRWTSNVPPDHQRYVFLVRRQSCIAGSQKQLKRMGISVISKAVCNHRSMWQEERLSVGRKLVAYNHSPECAINAGCVSVIGPVHGNEKTRLNL